MNRIYRGWLFNKHNGVWHATNRNGQKIIAKDEKWIMREIDRFEFDRLEREIKENADS